MNRLKTSDRSRFRLRLDPLIRERFPAYSVLVVYAFDIQNGPSDGGSVAALRAAEAGARARFGGQKANSDPHIAAWRQAFGAFGAKPSKYLCSAEALLARTLRGSELPEINRIVDYYNAVSVGHVLPLGGEDLDALVGDLVLTFATGNEPFDATDARGAEPEFPEPGEVIWADPLGVTCRRWNWRQGIRTRLTTETRNAYFVLDRLEPFEFEALSHAGDALIAHLRANSPGVVIEVELLGHGDEMT